MCPGLWSNTQCLRTKASVHWAFFDNNDGLMILRVQGRVFGLRLLLTDSGHYMIRTDRFKKKSNAEKVKEDELTRLAVE